MGQYRGFGTRSVHAGEAPDPTTGAFGVPIYQNTTYAFHSYDQLVDWRDGGLPHFYYLRDGNPTTRCLEVKLADLEGAEAAVAGASGMAVISATLLHLVPAGGQLVACVRDVQRHAGIHPRWPRGARRDRRLRGLSPISRRSRRRSGRRPAPSTPRCFSNPALRLVDLDALGALARARDLPLIVDNTFLSPAVLRPLEHGATLVLHSATKYLSGHGNVLAGVVCGPRGQIAQIARTLSHLGGALSPFNAWTLLNGVKTLPLRLAQHCANADAPGPVPRRAPGGGCRALSRPAGRSRPRSRGRLLGKRRGGMLARSPCTAGNRRRAPSSMRSNSARSRSASAIAPR